jgi:hypothetical protein
MWVQFTDWTHMIQDRGGWWSPVNTEMNIEVQYTAGNFLNSWATSSVLRTGRWISTAYVINSCVYVRASKYVWTPNETYFVVHY